jgi:CBS domain-containing protein
MKVLEVMTTGAVTCTPTTDLVSCARKMWDGDFGFLPVVGEHGEVVGVVTDRDICMGVAMNDRRPSDVRVSDVMTREIHRCQPDDTTDTVMRIMKEHQIRRLPVTDTDGVLKGIVSVNDLALSAGESGPRAKGAPVPATEVLATVRAIARHRATVET